MLLDRIRNTYLGGVNTLFQSEQSNQPTRLTVDPAAACWWGPLGKHCFGKIAPGLLMWGVSYTWTRMRTYSSKFIFGPRKDFSSHWFNSYFADKETSSERWADLQLWRSPVLFPKSLPWASEAAPLRHSAPRAQLTKTSVIRFRKYNVWGWSSLHFEWA